MIRAATKQSPNLVVIPNKRGEKLGAAVLKDESEVAVAAALEEFVSQLADAKTAMHMGLSQSIDEFAQGE